MKCVKCNQAIPDDSVFCPYCGANQAAQEVKSIQQEPEVVTTPAVQKERKPISVGTIIVCIVVMLALTVGILAYTYYSGYSNSVKAAQDMRYEEAVTLLTYPEITKYHDTQYVEYVDACKKLIDGDYSVKEYFLQLGDYLRSADMANECDYQTNMQLLAEGKYQEVVTAFHLASASLRQYRDFSEQYANALRLLIEQEITKADYKNLSQIIKTQQYCPGFEDVFEEMKPKLYNAAVKEYRNGSANCNLLFQELKDYKDTNKYLFLNSYLGITDTEYEKLLTMLDFEDAKERMLSSKWSATKFLTGIWKNNQGKYFYIKDDENHSCNYNIPAKTLPNSTYTISNGLFQLSDGTTTKTVFDITVEDKNTIKIFSWSDYSTYKLYRQ